MGWKQSETTMACIETENKHLHLSYMDQITQ